MTGGNDSEGGLIFTTRACDTMCQRDEVGKHTIAAFKLCLSTGDEAREPRRDPAGEGLRDVTLEPRREAAGDPGVLAIDGNMFDRPRGIIFSDATPRLGTGLLR